MESNYMDIVKRMKDLREILEITPEEMAEAAGVSVDEYLDCENGNKEFSFGFLYHCADKLGVDIIDLMTGENPRLSGYTVTRGGMGMPMKREEGFEYYHLAPNFKGKLAEPFLVKAVYREEEQTKPIELNTHDGQEFDYILEGTMRFVHDGHIEELYPGDSVLYNSAFPHGMIAIYGKDCTFLAIVLKDQNEEK